jgi:formamidopyrimidine-DNA glycosylase
MPELPEVETMVRYLRERAIDGKIVDVRIGRNPKDRYGDQYTRPLLVTQTLHTVGRRGKYMVFQLSDGLLVAHNAMSGYWDIKGDEWCFDYVEGARKSNDKDVRVEIDVICDKELKTIRFHDSRLFGRLKYYSERSIEDIPSLHALGPEALDTVNVDLTTDKSKRNWCILDVCMFNPKHEIKLALTDQTALAGIGNIYASEILHWAGVNPFRLCKSLSTDEWEKIYITVPAVLQAAIDRKLSYNELAVYRRKACLDCNGPVSSKELKGRNTFWCPSCQE